MGFALLPLQSRDAAPQKLDLFLLLPDLRVETIHFQRGCVVVVVMWGEEVEG